VYAGTYSTRTLPMYLCMHELGWLCVRSILCFDDSPAITMFGSNSTTRVPYLNGSVAGRSLVAWRSENGFQWRFAGVITDAKDMMAQPTRSLGKRGQFKVGIDCCRWLCSGLPLWPISFAQAAIRRRMTWR
jgi:hypothetical protein